MKFKWEQTCSGCPEQYDIYQDEKQVGYFRYRWGYLSVRVPDFGGREIFSWDGPDGLAGSLEPEDRERLFPLIELELAKVLDELDTVMKEYDEAE